MFIDCISGNEATRTIEMKFRSLVCIRSTARRIRLWQDNDRHESAQSIAYSSYNYTTIRSTRRKTRNWFTSWYLQASNSFKTSTIESSSQTNTKMLRHSDRVNRYDEPKEWQYSFILSGRELSAVTNCRRRFNIPIDTKSTTSEYY